MQDEPNRLRQVIYSRLVSKATDSGFFCPECGAGAIVATWSATYGKTRKPEALTSIRICSADSSHPEPLANPTI
jgi:hypothetical protein